MRRMPVSLFVTFFLSMASIGAGAPESGTEPASPADEGADPYLGGPYSRFSVQAATPISATQSNDFVWAAGDHDGDGRAEALGVKVRNATYGRVEVHALRGTDYQGFTVQDVTPITLADAPNFEWAAADWTLDRRADLFAIKTRNTGTGTAEVHVLDGAGAYRSFSIQTGTPISSEDASSNFAWGAGDYNGDKRADLYAIKTRNTGTGSVEVHVLDGARRFGAFLAQVGTPISLADAPNFAWAVADANGDGRADVVAIKRTNAATSTAEVHVLNAASSFGGFWTQMGSSITSADVANFSWTAGDQTRDGKADLLAIKTRNTGTGSIEVHALDAAASGGGQAFAPRVPPSRTTAASGAEEKKLWNGPDHQANRVLFVHGLQLGSPGYADCDDWNSVRDLVRSEYQGDSARLKRLGYYSADVDCDATINDSGAHDVHYDDGGDHTNDTNIRHLGYHFAWYVWHEFSKTNRTVDVVAHSMGGLITRYALAKVGRPNFPPYLRINQVVTLGTPHLGSGDSEWCHGTLQPDVFQCLQMQEDSVFIGWLKKHAQNPQGRASGIGTNWTLIAGSADSLVSHESALGMNAAHKVLFFRPYYSHSGLRDAAVGTGPNDANVRYIDYNNPYKEWGDAPRVFRWTARALASQSW